MCSTEKRSRFWRRRWSLPAKNSWVSIMFTSSEWTSTRTTFPSSAATAAPAPSSVSEKEADKEVAMDNAAGEPRFRSTYKNNYDLCKECFEKAGPSMSEKEKRQFVEEHDAFVLFQKKVLASPSLPISLLKALSEFGKRPLFGSRNFDPSDPFPFAHSSKKKKD